MMDEMDEPRVVHILHLGRALCGKSGVPGEWEPGHGWVPLVGNGQAAAQSTCEDCRRSAGWRGEDGKIRLGVGAAPEAAADMLALRGLFAAEGPALLRALFAWRGQGAITRWQTKSSRALAHIADRLAREYPSATAELQKAGTLDAVASALRAHQVMETKKGRALELGRVREELRSLAELVDVLANHAMDDAEDEAAGS